MHCEITSCSNSDCVVPCRRPAVLLQAGDRSSCCGCRCGCDCGWGRQLLLRQGASSSKSDECQSGPRLGADRLSPGLLKQMLPMPVTKGGSVAEYIGTRLHDAALCGTLASGVVFPLAGCHTDDVTGAQAATAAAVELVLARCDGVVNTAPAVQCALEAIVVATCSRSAIRWHSSLSIAATMPS